MQDKISAESADLPIVLVSPEGKIIYKNKSAYKQKFPQMGARMLRFVNKEDRERYKMLFKDEAAYGFFNFSFDGKEFYKGFASRKNPASSEIIIIYSKYFLSVGDEVLNGEFKIYYQETTQYFYDNCEFVDIVTDYLK